MALPKLTWLALIAPVGVVISNLPRLQAQSAESPATKGATFDVASVKPSPPIPPQGGVYFGPARGGPGTADPEQITWTYARLIDLLMTAYDVKNYQVVGPSWISVERYNITAKVPAGTTREQVNAMWRNLLAERFGVTFHHESKEFQVDDLVIAKGGSKLKASAEDDSDADGPPRMDRSGGLSGPGLVTRIFAGPNPEAHLVARAQPISKLTAMLYNQLHRPVIDKTGLTGKYDFTLDFTPDLNGLPPPPPGVATGPGGSAPLDSTRLPGPDVAGAIQEQLGLRLVSGKANLDVVVIEKAERVPTDN